MWLALNQDQRLALLAHEVAHLAQHDPARRRVTANGQTTLSGWLDLVTPPAVLDGETGTMVVIDDRAISVKPWATWRAWGSKHWPLGTND